MAAALLGKPIRSARPLMLQVQTELLADAYCRLSEVFHRMELNLNLLLLGLLQHWLMALQPEERPAAEPGAAGQKLLTSMAQPVLAAEGRSQLALRAPLAELQPASEAEQAPLSWLRRSEPEGQPLPAFRARLCAANHALRAEFPWTARH